MSSPRAPPEPTATTLTFDDVAGRCAHRAVLQPGQEALQATTLRLPRAQRAVVLDRAIHQVVVQSGCWAAISSNLACTYWSNLTGSAATSAGISCPAPPCPCANMQTGRTAQHVGTARQGHAQGGANAGRGINEPLEVGAEKCNTLMVHGRDVTHPKLDHERLRQLLPPLRAATTAPESLPSPTRPSSEAAGSPHPRRCSRNRRGSRSGPPCPCRGNMPASASTLSLVAWATAVMCSAAVARLPYGGQRGSIPRRRRLLSLRLKLRRNGWGASDGGSYDMSTPGPTTQRVSDQPSGR